MLAIRLQRQGRKGYATYRFIVQDAKLSPVSGRVVTRIGSYNPHTKEVNLDKEKAKFYLENGAQPSDSVVRIFKGENIKIPSWVEAPTKQKRDIRNPEKLRKNQPKDEKPAVDQPEEDNQAQDEAKAEDKPDAEEVKEDKKEDKSDKADSGDDSKKEPAEEPKSD